MTIPTAPALSNTDSDQIWRADRDHFLHPWTHFDTFKAEGSLVIAEGKGAYVHDSAGKRYLDGIGGLWCVNIGYGNEEMVQTIADQARRLAFFSSFVDTTNPPAAELAGKLAELAPGDLNHVCYTSTGSDANDTAVRLAHYYHARRGQPSKKHIIARRDGYHGSTYLGIRRAVHTPAQATTIPLRNRRIEGSCQRATGARDTACGTTKRNLE
jgi:putrescine aminotransferase